MTTTTTTTTTTNNNNNSINNNDHNGTPLAPSRGTRDPRVPAAPPGAMPGASPAIIMIIMGYNIGPLYVMGRIIVPHKYNIIAI